MLLPAFTVGKREKIGEGFLLLLFALCVCLSVCLCIVVFFDLPLSFSFGLSCFNCDLSSQVVCKFFLKKLSFYLFVACTGTSMKSSTQRAQENYSLGSFVCLFVVPLSLILFFTHATRHHDHFKMVKELQEDLEIGRMVTA